MDYRETIIFLLLSGSLKHNRVMGEPGDKWKPTHPIAYIPFRYKN
jgi:hypothetical protein